MTNIPGTVETVELEATKPPKVPWGPSTLVGILGIVGVIFGAVEGNDAVTIVSGSSTLLMMFSRGAQAVALIRAGARAALPFVSAAADLPDAR